MSALANSIGGIIVLGFDTARDALTAGERISEVKPFPLDIVNSDRCRKVIREYVHPSLDVEISIYEAADGKGVAAIVVHEGSSKPYILSKMIDEAGRTVGAHFGYSVNRTLFRRLRLRGFSSNLQRVSNGVQSTSACRRSNRP